MDDARDRTIGAIEIAPRFRGPPTSGNGGYVAGRLAAYLAAEEVRVRLERPPPLERRLVVAEGAEGVVLRDGEHVVARARAVDGAERIDLEPVAAPDFAAAVAAAADFRGFDHHVFPGCFVCGTERDEGDGLRIFPGPVETEAGLFAAPWCPDGSLTDPASLPGPDSLLGPEGALVAPAFLWAALDCPGAFSFPQPEGQVILLGELQARLTGPVEVGERCVLTSWEIEHDGRRHRTGSAIFGASGDLRGLAVGLWFEVSPDSVPGG